MNPKTYHKIIALSYDLLIAGIFYLLLISKFSPLSIYKTPTAFKQGYAFDSQVVHNEQVNFILVGVTVWTLYTVLSTYIIKKTVGQKVTGIYYKEEGFFRRFVSTYLSPLLVIDKLLLTKIKKDQKPNRVVIVLGSVLSLIVIPGLLLFISIAVFIFLNP